MNMFELVRGFWQMAELEKFSPTATSLYFYLLHRANIQKWQMPIRCPTESVRFYIETTKQSVLNARDELKRRGLIDFTPGTGKGNYPFYTLKPPNSDLTNGLTDDLTDGLTDSLTLYKNQDNKTENFTNNTRTCEEYLKDLENLLLVDKSWHQSVASLMSSKGFSDVDSDKVRLKMQEFFTYLKVSGIQKKSESDCRRHFVNWLAKNIQQNKNSNNEHSTINEDRRGADQGNAASTSSYFDSF